MLALLKKKSVRDDLWQFGFVSALALLVVIFALTARSNLEAQGLTSGFGFLDRATGWGVNFSLIEFSTSDTYLKVIWVGILNSLFIGAISLVCATFLGTVIGVMRVSGNKIAELVGTTFVEIFRNIPLLLQVYFWYALLTALPKPKEAVSLFDVAFLSGRGIYLPGLNVSGIMVFLSVVLLVLSLSVVLWIKIARRLQRLPQIRKTKLVRGVWLAWVIATLLLFWIGRIPDTTLPNIPYLKGLNYRDGIRVSPELLACIVGISIYGAAYIGEIVRAGFNSLSKGQGEAGHALGLTPWQTFTRIKLPLAIRAVMPTLINQYVWLFKSTTIGIAIGFVDFFMVISTAINQSGQTLELVAILMGGFLIINYSMAWLLNRVNDAIKLKGTQLRV